MDGLAREYARRLCEYAEARGRERAMLEDIYNFVQAERRKRQMSYDEVDSLRESVSDAQSRAAIQRIREACVESMRDERREVENLKKVIKEAYEELDKMRKRINEAIWRYDCATNGEDVTEEFLDE